MKLVRCAKLRIENAIITIGSITLDNLFLNNGKDEPVTFTGSVNADGSCNGPHYSDPYGNWNNVIAIGSVKITLTIGTVKNLIDSNNIRRHCVTSDGGYTFWNRLPRTNCTSNASNFSKEMP